MLLFWHVCGNYSTFCILTKQSILKQSHGNTKAKFYCNKRFDVQRTHWLEIVKETETLGVQLPSITADSVPSFWKERSASMEEPFNLFLKRKKKVLRLKVRATQIAQTQMTGWNLYWNDHESNYIATCQLIEKLLWQFRHTGMSNKDNEHFYKQRPLKLFKCNIIEMPFWCDYSIIKSEFLRHIR